MMAKFRFIWFWTITVFGSIITLGNCPETLSKPLLLEENHQVNYCFQRINNLKTFSCTLLSENNDDPFTLMKEESFGQLKIDMTAIKVIQLLGNPTKKSKSSVWGADGLYHQYWYYPKLGITLDMVSEMAEHQQKVTSIKLKWPSKLRTKRGIGIGSSFSEVQQAYQKEQDRENSIPFKHLVVGSIYGGLIFSFQENRVTEIFLGASAE